MQVDEAYALVARAIDTAHAAHGYLIVGDVRGNCAELVLRILEKLFPEAVGQVREGAHPDVVTLAPEGKKQIITIDAMRERIVGPMATTAFSGGWKVGVITGVDRLGPEAANAFLKSLEEPTPQTLYLMTTDQPDLILPTIVSRSQRIDLPLPSGVLTGEPYVALAEVFATTPDGVFERSLAAQRIRAVFADLKDENPDDVSQIRKALFRTILSFVRGWMVEGRVARAAAFRNVEAVEEAYRQSERALSDDAVLAFLMDRLVFPAAKK